MMPGSGKKKDLFTFEAVAIPYLNFIYKSAYRFCGNQTDAEDLSQETFQTAFEKFDQLRDTAKVKSWLFMILRNIYLKKVQQERKYPEVEMDESRYKPMGLGQEDMVCLKRIMDGEIQAALDKIDERYKTPLLLSYIGGYSYQEIAEMLEIPIGTVMSRIARGKMFLKRRLIETGKKKQ